jgi:hypothetical protein
MPEAYRIKRENEFNSFITKQRKLIKLKNNV